MTTHTFDPTVPRMQAEAGFELDDSAPPLRVSGFICLIFGVLSFFCTLGQPLLVLPLIAIVVGMFALRRSGGQTPVGTRAAMLGMILAAGFGACGLFIPWMKTMTLGRQAEKFSRDYMEVVARRRRIRNGTSQGLCQSVSRHHVAEATLQHERSWESIIG